MSLFDPRPSSEPLPLVWSIKEVAQALGLSKTKFEGMLRDPSLRIPRIHSGNRVLIPRQDFMRWLNVQIKDIPVIAPPTRRGTSSKPR